MRLVGPCPDGHKDSTKGTSTRVAPSQYRAGEFVSDADSEDLVGTLECDSIVERKCHTILSS